MKSASQPATRAGSLRTIQWDPSTSRNVKSLHQGSAARAVFGITYGSPRGAITFTGTWA